VNIEFDVLGTERVSREILRPADRSRDMRPAFRDALGLLERRAEDQFDTQGGQSGGWAPLAASTLRRKKGPQILIESGALKASLVSSFDADAIRTIGPDSAAYGTKVSYAQYHHRGTSRMPRRPLLALDEPTRRDIVRAFQRHLFDTAGARG
jgi:phage gpG-like protein